jgi:hypothetical protein
MASTSSTPVASTVTSACPIEINRRRFLRDMDKRALLERASYSTSSSTAGDGSIFSYHSPASSRPLTMEDVLDVTSTTEIRTTAALMVKNDIMPLQAGFLARPLLGDWNRKSSTDTLVRRLYQEELRRLEGSVGVEEWMKPRGVVDWVC